MSSVEQLENGRGDASAADTASPDEPTDAGGEGPDARDTGGGEPGPLSLDVVFDILKNQRRRQVYRRLKDVETARIGDLAEHVAALENEKDANQLTSAERKRVYVGLYQCHLPRMDDAGVVDFDTDRGVARLTDRASQLDTYLGDGGRAPERPWPLYYAGIVLVGAPAYVLSLVVPVAGVVPSLVVFAIVLATVACAVVHYRSETSRGGP